MRLLLTACLAACALLASLGAPAQVLRCTDPRTGKVTYTDGECTSGSQALEVEPRKTPEALRAEREQAAEAIARKQQRQQAEAAERQREAALQRAARAADAAQPFDYSQSTACRQSRQEVDRALGRLSSGNEQEQLRLQALQRQMDFDCLGPERFAEIERTRALQPAAPMVVAPPYRPLPRPPHTQPPQPAPHITHCNVFRCYDDRGGTHPR